MKVEERAQEILGELSRLRGDFAKIQENFRVLGRQLANASGSYSETERTMTKLDAKLTQIEQPPPQKEITPPPSLPGWTDPPSPRLRRDGPAFANVRAWQAIKALRPTSIC